MDKGFKFSGFHYDDSVDTFVRCHYDDAYICVLFDVANHILNSNTDEILEFRKRYWLEDTSMSDIMHADWCVLEFDNKTKMEEYLYEIGDGYLYAKFYAKGSLYDEICEHEE